MKQVELIHGEVMARISLVCAAFVNAAPTQTHRWQGQSISLVTPAGKCSGVSDLIQLNRCVQIGAGSRGSKGYHRTVGPCRTKDNSFCIILPHCDQAL